MQRLVFRRLSAASKRISYVFSGEVRLWGRPGVAERGKDAHLSCQKRLFATVSNLNDATYFLGSRLSRWFSFNHRSTCLASEWATLLFRLQLVKLSSNTHLFPWRLLFGLFWNECKVYLEICFLHLRKRLLFWYESPVIPAAVFDISKRPSISFFYFLSRVFCAHLLR